MLYQKFKTLNKVRKIRVILRRSENLVYSFIMVVHEIFSQVLHPSFWKSSKLHGFTEFFLRVFKLVNNLSSNNRCFVWKHANNFTQYHIKPDFSQIPWTITMTRETLFKILFLSSTQHVSLTQKSNSYGKPTEWFLTAFNC